MVITVSVPQPLPLKKKTQNPKSWRPERASEVGSCHANRGCRAGHRHGASNPGLREPTPGWTRSECAVVVWEMPGCSATSVPGRILRPQRQHCSIRSGDLHGMETRATRESDEAQVCYVPPGEREGIHHSNGFQSQKRFASLGEYWHPPLLGSFSAECITRHICHKCQADASGNIIHFYSSSSENTKSGRLLLHGTLTNRSDS